MKLVNNIYINIEEDTVSIYIYIVAFNWIFLIIEEIN